MPKPAELRNYEPSLREELQATILGNITARGRTFRENLSRMLLGEGPQGMGLLDVGPGSGELLGVSEAKTPEEAGLAVMPIPGSHLAGKLGKKGMGMLEDAVEAVTGAPGARKALPDHIPLPESSPGLPAGATGSFDPRANVPFTWKGKDPKDWSPAEFEEVGKAFGVNRLGPETPGKTYKTTTGGTVSIPGGLQGKFTYYDMLKMKADGINPAELEPKLHAKLQQKLSRSLEPDDAKKQSDAGVLGGLNFSMTSPANPLTGNEIAASRLRVNSKQQLDQLADAVPWKAGDEVDERTRMLYNKKIADDLGLGEELAGGLGIRGVADYTRVAEMAQLFRKDPSFFRKRGKETWDQFVERVMTQTPGLSAKTASFGVVWQDPAKAAISAIDRHMAGEFSDAILNTPAKRQAWEAKVIGRHNKNNPDAPISSVTELSDAKLSELLLEETKKGPRGKLRLRGGEENPNIPEHLRPSKAGYVLEPKEASQIGALYKAALEENRKRAKEVGLDLFEGQWHVWDRIRQRLEPHETMFPGLERLPRMSKDQLEGVMAKYRETGHTSTRKNEQGLLDPTRPESNPSSLGYFGIPLLAGGAAVGGMLSAEDEPPPL